METGGTLDAEKEKQKDGVETPETTKEETNLEEKTEEDKDETVTKKKEEVEEGKKEKKEEDEGVDLNEDRKRSSETLSVLETLDKVAVLSRYKPSFE